MKKGLLIFSDLDGTLLDYHTYSFKKAVPALKKIRQRNIPLIFCTSKTSVETEIYSKKLKICHPFIVENGGAIFIPEGYFWKRFPHMKSKNEYWVKELGTPYGMLRKKLIEVTQKYRVKIKGFGDMKPEEISKRYRLSLKEARLSKRREYDEPFYFVIEIDEETLNKIQKQFAQSNLFLTKGGRLFHLTGKNDKGKAVKILERMYEKEWKIKVKTIGIGDSLNDLPMLQAVDFPILVKLPNGSYDKDVLKNIKPFLTKGIGPEGWKEKVSEILKKF
jgi:mannosyl-3-phosphoglycerate phosphatase